MRKFAVLIVVIGAVMASQAGMALRISCPTQDDFNRFSQERVGPEQVRFSYFQPRTRAWSDLTLVVNVPLPYNQNARPVLDNTSIDLSYDEDVQAWKITCTYRETSGFGIADNQPTSRLIIAKQRASHCRLIENDNLVICGKS